MGPDPCLQLSLFTALKSFQAMEQGKEYEVEPTSSPCFMDMQPVHLLS